MLKKHHGRDDENGIKLAGCRWQGSRNQYKKFNKTNPSRDSKEIRKYTISGKRSNIDCIRNIVKYVSLYQLQAQCTELSGDCVDTPPWQASGGYVWIKTLAMKKSQYSLEQLNLIFNN